MEAKEFRELSLSDLERKRQDLKDEIFRFRMKRGTGQLENPMKLRQAKRDLARVQTVIREKTAGPGAEG